MFMSIHETTRSLHTREEIILFKYFLCNIDMEMVLAVFNVECGQLTGRYTLDRQDLLQSGMLIYRQESKMKCCLVFCRK